MAGDTKSIDDLLAHAGWLSALAHHLVRDDVAEDVVQQTWVAALQGRPDPALPPRPWLSTVLRNFIRQRGRAEGRRGRHEADAEADPTAAAPARAEPADALYERVALQRTIAERVMELDEPYRRVVLLRYFEGRSAAEIARALGVPAGTVRWRLKEALDRLRAALDRERGAQAWRALVAPGGGAPGTLLVAGGVMAKIKLVPLLVVVLLLALAGGGGALWRAAAREGRAPSRGGADGAMAAAAGSARPDRGVGGAGEPGVTSPSAVLAERAARARIAPPPKLLAGDLAAGERAADEGARPPTPALRGTSDKEEIRAAMQAVIPGIKRCYGELLLREPRAGGRVLFDFLIEDRDGVGRITEATLVPTESDGGVPDLNAPLTEQCFLRALVELPFPVPANGKVRVRYPFELAPQ